MEGDVMHLEQIPPKGILLDKGWKFHADNNSAYASPDYDDSKWKTINPTKDIHDLPQLWNNKVGWFRIHLTVDKSLAGRLAMMIQQSGASEMYLNGKLIHSFGVLHTDMDMIKAYNPYRKPVSLPVTQAGAQVLAIRYALQPQIWYTTLWTNQNMGLNISVNTVENANYEYEQGDVYNLKTLFFRVGMFGILAILYLTFYLFNPVQKVNLYFSVFAFLQTVTWAIFVFLRNEHFIQRVSLIANSLLIVQWIGFYFVLGAIYHLLNQKREWIYYSILTLGVISIPLGTFIYGWGWLIFGIVFTNLINFEITRVALLAVRRKTKGAWILAAGGLGFLGFWLLFTISSLVYAPLSHVSQNLFTLAYLSIPVAVSIYLGYDFALTTRYLQLKLKEVENLSFEKQQILYAQNETLEKQVNERTVDLQNSLIELKSTQSQLIQSEKMASLGELTAGIAHEIQNPLNFVNNFSEVNQELLTELVDEADRGNTEEVKAIANDIKENSEKINHHGKRADAIVKGMLQHSRTGNATKEPTDINKLADEYLRLAYHGLRAKDKSFNATMKTDFDETIDQINIVSQDIGRVILNLITNAFYTVTEKKEQKPDGYEPTVAVSTKKMDDKVLISIKDNGIGIPQKILDKIFQPFFTTKSAGQGTGLGFSLAYDIIKAHGAELRVETKEGDGSEFIILLPM